MPSKKKNSPKPKPRRFGETLPLRLSTETESKVAQITQRVGLTKSDVVRMAITHGLPLVEAGRLPKSA